MDPEAGTAGLQAALRHDPTPGGAVALLVFFAFATAAPLDGRRAVRRETRRLEAAGRAVRVHDADSRVLRRAPSRTGS